MKTQRWWIRGVALATFAVAVSVWRALQDLPRMSGWKLQRFGL